MPLNAVVVVIIIICYLLTDFNLQAARSNAMSVSVCLVCFFLSVSLCLSVRLHISKTARPNFTKFSVPVICGRGSVLLRQQCNTSGFVDEVTFAHNGPLARG